MLRVVILVAATFGCGATAFGTPPRAKHEFTGHFIGSCGVGFSSCGTRVASQAVAIELGGTEVLVWDVATGKLTHKFSNVHGFAFDPTGDRIALGQSDGKTATLTVTDLKTRKAVFRLTEPKAQSVGRPAYSADGKTLYYRVGYFAADQPKISLKSVDPATGKPGMTLVEKQWTSMAHPALTADGKLLVCSRYDTITMYDTATGKLTAKLSGHKYNVSDVTLVPGDKFLVSTGQDRKILLWDLATKKVVWTGSVGGGGGVLVTRDGKRILTGGADETLRVWDVETGKQFTSPKLLTRVPLPDYVPNGQSRGINALGLSPNGKSVVVGGFDRAVKVFALADLISAKG